MWCRQDARLWHCLLFVSYILILLCNCMVINNLLACIRVLFIFYKPFMRCRSDARLWHVDIYSSFISPLCGVAQTPDCGIFLFYMQLFEESFQTLGPCILFLLPYCMFICFLHTCITGFCLIRDRRYHHENFSEHDYLRVLNVCEYIQTYSLACPWLLSWPDSLLGDKHCDDSPGTYAMTIAAAQR